MRLAIIAIASVGLVGTLMHQIPASASAAAEAAPGGGTLYKRCAACHLATGTGIPGAFPPLKANIAGLVKRADGRRYMVLSVLKGVSGPITVGGKPYRGSMPAHSGMKDADVAATLNHVVVKLAGSTAKPFTEAEVKAVRAGSAGILSSQVGQMRAALKGL